MKTVCRILALMLILSLAAGCAQSAEEAFDLNFSSSSDESALDFNGLELLYRINLDSGNGVDSTENYLGYTLNTEFSDLAMQRVRDLENRYKFKLNVTNDTADLVNMTAGGLRFADIFLSPSFNFFAWSKAGLLTGISTLSEYIDYRDSEKWGSPLILESMFYGNDVYGLTPNAWPEQNYTSFGYPLIANVDLIMTNGALNPRELVEEGVWVWDTFTQELEKNTVMEGSTARSYGLVTSYPYFAQMMILSNGARFAERDEDGNYYCGYYTPQAMRAMEMIREIWYGKYEHTVMRDEVYYSEVVMRNFTSEHGAYAFLPTHFLFGVYGEVAMNLDNFAILPTPTGPDVPVGYMSSVHHTMYYTISFPISSSSTDAAATVVNEIYEPLPGFETKDDIKSYMSRNYFFDERDADVFFELFENSYYNYDYTTGFESRRIPEGLCTSNRALSELLTSNEPIIEKCFTEYVNPTLSAYTALFEGN
jgi:hypothetical protein